MSSSSSSSSRQSTRSPFTQTPFRLRSSSTRIARALAVDQRVPPRDGGVVEADVRREAAAEPRPALLQRDDADAVAVVVGEVVAARDERLARGRRSHSGCSISWAPQLAVPSTANIDERAKLSLLHMRARRDRVALVQSDRVTAAFAVE